MAAYIAGKADKALHVLEDGLDALVLPGRYRQCLRTTTMVERLNEEIRRLRAGDPDLSERGFGERLLRTGGVGEKWISRRRYVAMEEYWDSKYTQAFRPCPLRGSFGKVRVSTNRPMANLQHFRGFDFRFVNVILT